MRPIYERSSLATSPTLLENLKKEEKEAWVQLVECYSPRLTAICLAHGIDGATTQDILQETWISVGRSVAKFNSVPGHGAFRAWLRRILLRRIADHRRQRNPIATMSGGNTLFGTIPSEFEREHSSHPDAIPLSGSNPLSKLPEELARNIASVRQTIDERTWEIFARAILDGASTEEVAQEFSITPANVRQIRSRVLRKLRKSITADI